jgi:lysophospholipase L1-like esterase
LFYSRVKQPFLFQRILASCSAKKFYTLNREMEAASFTYLALGDSYTVGEGLETMDSFPFQVVRKLNENVPRTKVVDESAAVLFERPLVIAATGWTTSELIEAIRKAEINAKFDIVTLLIGVNNQYRGLAPDEYAKEFEQLASVALAFADNDASKVIVLSIPDWSATPFAAELDRESIRLAIDRFNLINRQISLQHGFHYIDITEGSRNALTDPSLVAQDQLHPSATEYRKWCDKLVHIISQRLLSINIDQKSK